MKTLNLNKDEIVNLKNIIRNILENIYDVQNFIYRIEYNSSIDLNEFELQTLINLANELFNKGELVKICKNASDVSI